MQKQPKYYLNSAGEFIIENYNFSQPFANFFPGIAGKYGIPIWVFYVNRGQAISSFGTQDKDHAILEFFPANRAWQITPAQGFRTFIKSSEGKKTTFYEPFQNSLINAQFKLKNQMRITSYGLGLNEENNSLGLNIKIEYFTIPNDSYAGLARIVTIKNLSKSPKKIEVLDGLPQIVPFGTNNFFLKKMSRTIEAWMSVENLKNKAPFYKLAVDPADRPEVIHIEGGNFFLGFHYQKERAGIIKPVVNPQCIFGQITDFSFPYNFLSEKKFSYPGNEMAKGKTPCGFIFLDFRINPGQEKIFYCLIGHMRNKELLNSSIERFTKYGYLRQKRDENKKIIEELQSDINTRSSCREFDLYAKQTYLDNIMRGGYPLTFSRPSINLSGGIPTVFYLYSRKHGDLERDYNKFQLQPAYFSQGNGNYRDMNQNRRCDIWFNPDIKDENIISFFNLLQSDGFNPLVIKGSSFTLKNEKEFKDELKNLIKKGEISKAASLLNKPFSPGEVMLYLEENKIKLKVSYDDFLNILLSNSTKNEEAEHGEGFWIDHWIYNLDLIESYLGVYPEKLNEIVFRKRAFTFYDNAEVVKPRSEKYVLYKKGLLRQLHSIMADNAKKEMIKKRQDFAHTVRTQYGQGPIYRTTLINKLLCLFVNKMASLDPFGTGIEMEANKPNWFDSLNGLPALFGSSLCETQELKRGAIFIKDSIEKSGIKKINLSEETCDFLISLGSLIQEFLSSESQDKDYQYWDKSSSLKEGYRQKTKLGFSGEEIELSADEITAILNNALKKLGIGINKAKDKKTGIYSGYFINQVSEYHPLEGPFVKPEKFSQKRLPLFLEPQMHALRIAANINKAKGIYKGVKKSALYDKKLKMYKVTASLKSCPEEIGRCSVFTPGWLENESIWLHMEYKYILEVLKQGLYDEFYEDFKNVLIPFQNPQRYGRSILENSSFLVSSAFPDKTLHGNGFVARLSGSTAEFLQIWLIMNVGKTPFILNSRGELNLQLNPILPAWLFTKKDNTYSFNFLSKIKVTYHNQKKKNTFGKNAVRPKKIIFNDKNGNPVKILSDAIPAPYAEQIRSRQINIIDIYLE